MARNYDTMIKNVLRSLESSSQTRSSSGATIWKAEIRHEGLNRVHSRFFAKGNYVVIVTHASSLSYKFHKQDACDTIIVR